MLYPGYITEPKKGGVTGVSFKWRELGREARNYLLIVNIDPLGEDSEHRSKFSKIRYGDYSMKILCFPYLKRIF